jgi:eukaryotic-like serine/threonine-protein kinase
MDDVQQLENRATAAIGRKDFAAARQDFEAAVRLTETNPSADPNVVGRLLNNAGYACRQLGDLDPAEDHFRRAVEAHRRTGDPDNPELAVSLHHLGRMAHYRRAYDQSWACWTEALEIWKRLILGKGKREYLHYLASTLHACGEHLADTGKHQAARQNFEQALGLRESILSPDHSDIAENVYHLGLLCLPRRLGRGPTASPTSDPTLHGETGSERRGCARTAHYLEGC